MRTRSQWTKMSIGDTDEREGEYMKTCLVLEGGAMRSLYTSGVLDVFMSQNIDIDCTIGVSAGALVGSNYVSNQKGRSACINIQYCKDSRYIGVKALKNNKGLFGFDYLFGDICKVEKPFDQEAFFNSYKRFVAGATNCVTGKTEYFEKDRENLYKILQASSSMPLVSKIVEINGQPYLDGAIDCNVPIDWALEQGYEKIVTVLTRDKGYQKEPVPDKMKKVYNKVYKSYPYLVESIGNRPEKYNQIYQRIQKLEEEKKIFVLQPKTPIVVSKLERNPEKLKKLYKQGIEEAEEKLPALKQYLGYI